MAIGFKSINYPSHINENCATIVFCRPLQ